jgi:hypothetical protein
MLVFKGGDLALNISTPQRHLSGVYRLAKAFSDFQETLWICLCSLRPV